MSSAFRRRSAVLVALLIVGDGVGVSVPNISSSAHSTEAMAPFWKLKPPTANTLPVFGIKALSKNDRFVVMLWFKPCMAL